ncbi:MAG: SCP2 sterol-binding domain-containing protein [Piscinibacter sp.]
MTAIRSLFRLTMNLDECTAAIRGKVGDDSGLNATLKFDCGEAGSVYVDGKAIPNAVDNRGGEADCTVGITLDNLAAMLRGELEPATGFMTGKLKVAGDMSVALRMQRVV